MTKIYISIELLKELRERYPCPSYGKPLVTYEDYRGIRLEVSQVPLSGQAIIKNERVGKLKVLKGQRDLERLNIRKWV